MMYHIERLREDADSDMVRKALLKMELLGMMMNCGAPRVFVLDFLDNHMMARAVFHYTLGIDHLSDSQKQIARAGLEKSEYLEV